MSYSYRPINSIEQINESLLEIDQFLQSVPRVYHGRIVGASGTLLGQSGFYITKNGTGSYTVTHRLNNTDYSLLQGDQTTGAHFVSFINKTGTSFDVQVTNSAGTPVDANVDFLLAADIVS